MTVRIENGSGIKRCAYCGKEVPGPERICNDQCRAHLARVRRIDKAARDHFAAERLKAMTNEDRKD